MEQETTQALVEASWVKIIKDLVMAFVFAFAINLIFDLIKNPLSNLDMVVAVLFYNFRAQRRIKELNDHVVFMNDKILNTLQTHNGLWAKVKK